VKNDATILRTLLKSALTILVVSTFAAADEKVNTAMIAKIRSEGLDHSPLMEVFDHLVNLIGRD
jgi:hypothetical protein